MGSVAVLVLFRGTHSRGQHPFRSSAPILVASVVEVLGLGQPKLLLVKFICFAIEVVVLVQLTVNDSRFLAVPACILAVLAYYLVVLSRLLAFVTNRLDINAE